MTTLFSSPDVMLWKALIATKVLMCVCILKTKLFHRLPWFSAYLLATGAKSLVLFAVASWSGYAAYYYAFYACSYIEAALVLFTLVECALQVLPGFNLPKKNQAVVWLVGVVVVTIGFATIWPLRFVENRVEIGCYWAIAISSFAIGVYVRYLGLRWSRLIARLTWILGLMHLVDGFAKMAMAHYSLAVLEKVRPISELVNIAAVIAWTIVILMPWGEYDPSDDELAQARQMVDDIESNLRHLAAGGGK